MLDLLFHVLELVATFAAGAWTGNHHCRVAFCLSTDEERKESWLDRCWPRKRAPYTFVPNWNDSKKQRGLFTSSLQN
jgi:hypothetical protein